LYSFREAKLGVPHEKDPVFVESLKISGTELDERIFSEELDNEAFELDSNTSLLLLTKISDELEKSTLSVADDRSVEFDSSTTLDELSTARTSPELPKSPKASESATFSDSEQATNETSKNKKAIFSTNPPPKPRNNH
jgi:hypothetical protein